jgi:hypothetical protein
VGGAALLVAACQGPDEYFRGAFEDAGFDGPSLAGHGGTAGTGGHTSGAAGSPTGLGGMATGVAGTTGMAGTTGTAGSPAGSAGNSGSAGTTGAGGTTAGRGGTTGAAGTTSRGGTTGTAGSPGRGGTTGAAGSSTAGTTGTGGGVTGRGGTTGTAGSGGSTTGRGGTTGTAGATGRGGSTGTGGSPATVLYSEDFEGESVGSATAADWSRSGGSSGDWVIATDGTKVIEQNGATSSTVRMQSATGASGAPWSGAISASARVKLLSPGSGSPAAMVCVRFNDISNRYCGALVPNGVQILTAVGGTAGQSAVFTATVAAGTFYDLRVSVDASNVLTVYLGGTQRGTYTPGVMTNGTVAVGTISTTAAFDNVSVTRP